MSDFTVSNENLAKTVKDTLSAGRKAERGYDALVVFYSLTSETSSKEVTEAARAAVLAAYPDTDPARLAGKNKNDDQRWKDARAIRFGLVSAINRATVTDDDTEKPVKAVNLITREGAKAELAAVVAAWHAAQVKK